MGHDSKNKRHRDHSDANKEEKDIRKARKKAEKAAKMLGYTNDTNPFGDSNLLQPFVWGKKKEKDKTEGRVDVDSEESRLEIMREIERVRKRRDDREKELEEMERLRTEEQRLREASQYGDWQKKEDEFHMEQTRVRSKIRLIEKREQPIDILAKNILQIESANDPDQNESDLSDKLAALDVEIRDPVEIINEVHPNELGKLQSDVENYLQLEQRKKGIYIDFWMALLDVVSAERKKYNTSHISTLHKSVAKEAQDLFRGKSSVELTRLVDDILKSLREGRRSDVEYWEHMISEVRIECSRMRLREIHQSLLKKQLDVLRIWREREQEKKEKRHDDEEDGERERESIDLQPDEREKERERERKKDDSAESLEMLSVEQQRGLGESEEHMPGNDEIALPGSTYWWQDKYRPRKPRYFNRVRTGYDWNKYNQTHYDHDNPPPKTIQGYKFNIFYPDLIDKLKTPQYFVEASDDPEFAILRFHSGPPYEDIAFKIVNREW
eukprot:CAMPEP_0182428010 /NCGR_PEP_ID=MMETSP1167-20130531/20951_1 /TAXON_ID=2988 /ORGANISM="Mallomonas Sp, Strain CCMP3275" /LENGTH=496 /DNA_ID=CAMNT_0024610633 /DNA_START=57 /DNA_END=1544 /DNA_ORIENTATION=-